MSIKYSILFCLSLTTLLTASRLHVNPRDTLLPPPIVNTTIIDQNGKDVSSSFTKKVFYYNTTLDPVSGRIDAQDKVARMLNTCADGQGTFMESSCNYKPGVLGSIRRYSYKCRNFKKGVRNKKYGVMEERVYFASCTDREICIDGRLRRPNDPKGPGLTAFCINMDAFSAANEPILPDASNATLTTLLTSGDMQTPLMGDRIDIETDLITSTEQEEKPHVQECLNCTSLMTEELTLPFGLDFWAWLEIWTAGLAGVVLLVFFG